MKEINLTWSVPRVCDPTSKSYFTKTKLILQWNHVLGHLGNTVTLLYIILRPVFMAQQNGHTFPYKKKPVNAVTR